MSVTWESRSKGYRGRPGDGMPSQVFKVEDDSVEAKARAKKKAQEYAGILSTEETKDA